MDSIRRPQNGSKVLIKLLEDAATFLLNSHYRGRAWRRKWGWISEKVRMKKVNVIEGEGACLVPQVKVSLSRMNSTVGL